MNIDNRGLKIARVKANLTLVQLAKQSGINRITLSNIEKGSQKPSVSTINKLSEVLGMKVEDIIL